MNRLFGSCLLYLLIVMTTACTDTQHPRTHLNPHPKMRYDITLTIENAPGPFDSVEGRMQYEVRNPECVPESGIPVMNPMRLPPKASPRITFQKLADGTYQGTIFADYFLDENYFGLGTCHWSLIAITTELKINKLSMVSHLMPEPLFAERAVTTYFARKDYLSNDTIERFSIGATAPSKYPPELQDGIFSVTLTPKEIIP